MNDTIQKKKYEKVKTEHLILDISSNLNRICNFIITERKNFEYFVEDSLSILHTLKDRTDKFTTAFEQIFAKLKNYLENFKEVIHIASLLHAEDLMTMSNILSSRTQYFISLQER